MATLPTREEAEGAARPLVQVHVVGVDVAHQDAVVVVVQVVPAEHVELPPHRRHDVVNPPLQHGTAGQPLVLKKEAEVVVENGLEEVEGGRRQMEGKKRRERTT